MTGKSGPIATFTADELAQERAAGRTESDWAKAAETLPPDGSDPDDGLDDLDWIPVDLVAPKRKSHASLRIDSDVLDWFRSQGKGYQTRINAILRAYYEHQTR